MITIGHRRSTYQHSNIAPRLSGQTSIFGVVFFVSRTLLEIERRKKLKIFTISTRTPRSDVRILIYQTTPISRRLFDDNLCRRENYFFFVHGRHYRYMVLSPFVKTNKTDSWIRISSYNVSFPPSFYGVGYEYRMLGECLPLYYIFLDFK